MGPKNFLWDCPRAADVTSRSMSRGSITVCYLAQQEHINSLLTKPRRASFHLRTSMLSLIKSERLWLGGLAILRWLYLYNWRTKMLTVLYNMQAYRHYSKIIFLWGPLTLSYACYMFGELPDLWSSFSTHFDELWRKIFQMFFQHVASDSKGELGHFVFYAWFPLGWLRHRYITQAL